MILLFMDCETTGLDPVIHVPWEIAAVRAEHTADEKLVELASAGGFVHLTDAEEAVGDPVGLEIGRFVERYHAGTAMYPVGAASPGRAAAEVDALCDDRPHLVGAVPSFDDRRVGDMMRRCGRTPRWHYHLIDVETLAVGWLARSGVDLLEWKSDQLSLALGVDPELFDRHTAMGDVRWCMAQYAAVFGLEQVGPT